MGGGGKEVLMKMIYLLGWGHVNAQTCVQLRARARAHHIFTNTRARNKLMRSNKSDFPSHLVRWLIKVTNSSCLTGSWLD